MAGADASVTATFGGDTTPLRQSAGQGAQIVEGFGASVKKIASDLRSVLGDVGVGFLAGFFANDALGKLKEFFGEIQEDARRLRRLHDEFSLGTDEIQAWEKLVKRATGSVDGAQLSLEKTRKALSELADGQQSAVKNFAALGLSAEDFIGLSLDQALQKIAQGYAANKDQAGAYAAVVDILGARQAPKLVAALDILANKSLREVGDQLANLSDKYLPSSLVGLNTFGDTMKEYLWTRPKVLIGNLLGIIFSIPSALGTVAGAITNFFDGIGTNWKGTIFATNSATKALDEFKAKTAEAGVTDAERATAAEEAHKRLVAFGEQLNKTQQAAAKEQAARAEKDRAHAAEQVDALMVQDAAEKRHIEEVKQAKAAADAKRAQAQADYNGQIAEQVRLEDEAAEAERRAYNQKVADMRNFEKLRVALAHPDYSQYSTAALDAQLKQLKDREFSMRLEYQQGPSALGGISGQTFENSNYEFLNTIATLEQELKFRSGFSSALASGGQQGALNYFVGQGRDALAFDNVYRSASSWGQGLDQTNAHLSTITTGITAIAGGLKKVGIG